MTKLFRTVANSWGSRSIRNRSLFFYSPRPPVLLRLCLLLLAFAPVAIAQHGTPAVEHHHHEVLQTVVHVAIEQTRHAVRYDPSYVRIPYPGGDVPANTGVCTDVLIRAYRTAGIDLQKLVHEDMIADRSAYPHRWHAQTPGTDTNIDHRRVPNLMTFFRRKGESLALSNQAADYLPGDVVAWDLGAGVLHIGLVVDKRSADGNRFLIVHNIGRGPQLEDVLFHWKIVGHYRYFGPK